MKRLTNKEFIDKAIEIHDGKYSYSECNYENSKTKIIITCPSHGNFGQRASAHISNQKQGCPKCNHESKQTGLTEFIARATKIHGNKYDYTLVSEYKPNREPVDIICPNHGPFNTSINHHINRCQGCPKCKSLDNTEFITKSNLVHVNKYDYSKVNYINNKTKVDIICPNHGLFSQRPIDHFNGNGCPICNESRGERNIRKILTELNIKFKPQHKFPECKYKKELPFDFYLPDLNICIEYNGIQHYKPIDIFGGLEKLIKQEKLDLIKKTFCEDNQIKLLIIRYNENIKTKLAYLF
jgi:hypothetical protein